jgi:hypothetical protein
MTIRIFPKVDNLAMQMVTKFFTDNGINYSFDTGNIAFIVQNGDLCVLASALLENYPLEVMVSLSKKDTMMALLGGHNFNTLPVNVVHTYNDINMQNFLIRPNTRFGHVFNKRNEMNQYGHLDSTGFYSVYFSYNRYKSNMDLLGTNTTDYVNEQLAIGGNKGYAIHSVSMTDDTVIRISGSVNGNSDILFSKTTVSNTIADPSKYSFLATYSGYDAEKTLIQNFIKETGTKNCIFNVDFIPLNGNLYPVNWDPKMDIIKFANGVKSNPTQLKRILFNMCDMDYSNIADPKPQDISLILPY